MVLAIPFFRFLLLASLVLAEAARAETLNARLLVTAEVLVSCQLEASVPRVGTPGRSGGSASFSVTCIRGAATVAVACDGSCVAAAADDLQAEYRLTEIPGDGSTVATVFF